MTEHPAAAPPATVLFVAGMGRSGSTIFSRLLGQVPGVCSVGELCYLWDQGLANNRTCGCGQPFLECPFWTSVGEHAFGGWDQVDHEHAYRLRRATERIRYVPAIATGLGSDLRARIEEYTALTSRVYRGIRDASGAEVVVDASKYPSTAYVALRTPGIDVRLLHLVRTSQGVAYSWSKVVERPDRDGKPLARFAPSRSALDWNVYNVLIELAGRRGGQHGRLRYEDFIADPAGGLRVALRLAGIPDSVPLDFVDGQQVELRPTHTVAGNPMRFRSGQEELRRDDAWRTEMRDRDRRLVSALTWPTRARYGYLGRDA